MILVPAGVQTILWNESECENKGCNEDDLDVKRVSVIIAQVYDCGGDTVSCKYPQGHADLQESQPGGFQVLSKLVDPDWVVDEQEHLEGASQEP